MALRLLRLLAYAAHIPVMLRQPQVISVQPAVSSLPPGLKTSLWGSATYELSFLFSSVFLVVLKNLQLVLQSAAAGTSNSGVGCVGHNNATRDIVP